MESVQRYRGSKVDRRPCKRAQALPRTKLPEAIICSGERDAVCVRSLGYYPLWLNSETYQVSQEEWNQITKYVETVYNIPDIDATGRLKGTELALRFIDIHTIGYPKNCPHTATTEGNPVRISEIGWRYGAARAIFAAF